MSCQPALRAIGVSTSGVHAARLAKLKQRIDEIECGVTPAAHAGRLAILSLGVPALDALLPRKGLPAGSLVELLSAAEGAGAWTLALVMARHVCGGDNAQKVLVIVDREQCFYAPAALGFGLDPGRIIVVRPRSGREAYAALHLSLCCPAVGAAISWCDRLRTEECRRLQLAAEKGGGLGFLLGPSTASRIPSFATLRLLVTPVASSDASRRVRIDMTHCRGGMGGRQLLLEIDDETGDVRVPARLAASAARARAARA